MLHKRNKNVKEASIKKLSSLILKAILSCAIRLLHNTRTEMKNTNEKQTFALLFLPTCLEKPKVPPLFFI